MTTYYLDDSWNLVKAAPTHQDLSNWANYFQVRYFHGCEPGVDLIINTNPNFQGASAFEPSEMRIHIWDRILPLESLTKIAILHEMIHVRLFAENGDADENHGPRFKAEIQRLQQAGAYDALL
jgi:hypothetical protein